MQFVFSNRANLLHRLLINFGIGANTVRPKTANYKNKFAKAQERSHKYRNAKKEDCDN